MEHTGSQVDSRGTCEGGQALCLGGNGWDRCVVHSPPALRSGPEATIPSTN